MGIQLVDNASLSREERTGLEAILGPLGTLERVLSWLRSLTPPGAIAEIVTQDEYTHDVLVAYGPRYLVFDTS